MKKSLGELKHLNPRSIWGNEARDFTPWLAENIDALAEVLGTDLEVSATEAAVGDFSVDIHAKDLATGRDVVIENQFGQTDHDHLGKLLTYASGVDATTLVWIAESIRDEHRQALEWLNERTDTDTMFFAIVLEVLQIDDSAPAYNFKPVSSPTSGRRQLMVVHPLHLPERKLINSSSRASLMNLEKPTSSPALALLPHRVGLHSRRGYRVWLTVQASR